MPLIEKNEFNLAIAHCLGVDSLGHHAHSNVPYMGEKLDYFNK